LTIGASLPKLSAQDGGEDEGMAEEVSFSVGGVEVRADLYLPPDLKPGERRPAIVAGHGFGFVKEGLVTQGEHFSAAGYVVLAIDYRSFGRSGGEVRGELFPERQMEDFSGGISYLQTRPDVEPDRIALWGTSFGGALVLGTAARDRRARVTVAQVPIVDGLRWMRWLRTPEQWEVLLDAIDEDRARRHAGEPSARIPLARHFSSTEVNAMPTDAGVLKFMDLLDTMVKTWRPDIAMESMEKIIAFQPIATIDRISPRPLCIIMNTGYEALHPRDQIMEAHAAASEPKKLVLLPYDQLGFYAPPGDVEALQSALDFFEEHLPVHGTLGREPARSKFDF
jgi:uncharacterized protein